MEDSSITPEQADAEDNDPWTSFGPYSDTDIAAVCALLEKGAVSFRILPNAFPSEHGGEALRSLTPHHLWVHDDHADLAESILVPYFKSKKDLKP